MIRKLSAVSYLVKNYDEAIAWFTAVLAFVLVEDIPLGAGQRWVVVAAQGTAETRLLLTKAEGADQIAAIGKAAGGRVAFFLNIDNFAREYERMLSAGVKFNEPPRHEAYGTVAVFEDLYGNRWDLIEPKERPI